MSHRSSVLDLLTVFLFRERVCVNLCIAEPLFLHVFFFLSPGVDSLLSPFFCCYSPPSFCIIPSFFPSRFVVLGFYIKSVPCVHLLHHIPSHSPFPALHTLSSPPFFPTKIFTGESRDLVFTFGVNSFPSGVSEFFPSFDISVYQRKKV